MKRKEFDFQRNIKPSKVPRELIARKPAKTAKPAEPAENKPTEEKRGGRRKRGGKPQGGRNSLLEEIRSVQG